MTRKLVGLILVTMLLSGCAASRAFRHGQDSARVGDWDAAVTHFTKAVQDNPDNPEYKINLQRANQEAARVHIGKAHEFEGRDDLDGALAEYRRAMQFDSNNRIAASRVAELEKTIRDRIEAGRPKPRIDQLREQARSSAPILNPASREPLKIKFNNSSLRDILTFIGQSSGINVTYDSQFVDKPYTVDLEGVTLEEGLQQVLTANNFYYKVTNPRTIIVIPDQPAKHAQYDDLVVKVFFISNADATDLNQTLNTIMRVPQMPVQPAMLANKTANTITVRATAPVMDVIERIIRANDKPRAEVILDIEILEVNRERIKKYGLNLSAYAANLVFSPETSPPATGNPTFNLNTISHGVNTADFYLGVPTAVVNFLESDSHSRTLAKPQLRGAEGQKMTLNLGQDIPVISTVFGAAAAGGFATIPQSSYSYRTVGVNLDITPRVTYEGEILLELSVDNSALGTNIDVAGQSIPSFTKRTVTTHLRLREGESNLLAGLIREDERKARSGLPGLMHLPGFKQLLSGNDLDIQNSDIVMLITPHVIRTHELTAEDLGSIYIGTQQNIGLSGAPQLIAAQPEAAAQTPGNPAAPPAASPVPTLVTPVPSGVAPPVQPPVNPPPGVPPPTGVPGTVPATPAAGAPGQGQPGTTPAQIIVTPPGTEFRVAGGPYTVPVSINNASRVSVITVTITYNPNVLRVRTVQEGTFMRQGGVTASFTPNTDAATGRVDMAIIRAGDQTGASGAGLLAAILFDAVAPGSSALSITGVANTPEGTPVPLTFSPVSVTVR